MDEAIFWTLWAIACVVGVTVFVFGVTLLVSWVEPRLKSMEEGKGFIRPKVELDYKACCPPGLGCNDTQRAARCRRDLALELSNVEEAQTLDGLWSEYQKTGSMKDLGDWESYRDSVLDFAIARKLQDVADAGKARQMLLEPGGGKHVQNVKGEVVEDAPHKTSKWKREFFSGNDEDRYP